MLNITICETQLSHCKITVPFYDVSGKINNGSLNWWENTFNDACLEQNEIKILRILKYWKQS